MTSRVTIKLTVSRLYTIPTSRGEPMKNAEGSECTDSNMMLRRGIRALGKQRESATDQSVGQWLWTVGVFGGGLISSTGCGYFLWHGQGHLELEKPRACALGSFV